MFESSFTEAIDLKIIVIVIVKKKYIKKINLEDGQAIAHVRSSRKAHPRKNESKIKHIHFSRINFF